MRSGLAGVNVVLDGKQYLPYWKGDPASLGMESQWRLPSPRQLGLAIYKDRVTFHSVRIRMVSGRASLDPAVAESAPPQVAPAMAITNKPTGVGKLPLGKGTDLLG